MKNLEKKLIKYKAKTKKKKKRIDKLFNKVDIASVLFEIVYDKDENPIDFIFRKINLAFEEKFCIVIDRLIDKKLSEITRPNLAELTKKYFKIKKLGDVNAFEFFLSDYSKCFEIKNYKFKKKYFISVFEELTELKHLNSKLFKLETAIDQSVNAVIITDIYGNIEYVNKKFTETTGFTFFDAIGKNPSFLKSGQHPVEYYENLWNTITVGKSWRGVFHNKRKDGSLYWESAVISPIFDKKGQIINYLGIKEDITDKRKMEQDLILAKEKAEQSDRLKSAFLANVSHEIRTPLNAIIGFSEFLVKDISEKDKKMYGEIVKNSSNDLLNIINDILDIAKIESGHTELVKEEFSVNELMTEIFEYFKYKKDKLNKQHIVIKYNQKLIDSDAKILSDRGRIKQVIINLLENAFKFTSEGYIEFGCKLKIDKNPNELEFFVKDSGIGISKEKQKFIFDRFRQVDESTSRTYGGTGLGLSISKSLAQLIGGDLSMTSKEGEGSHFFFCIPYTHVVTDNNIELAIEAGYKIPKGKKILVVEDVHSNFELVNEILEEYDPIILHAVSGLQAIELYKKNIDTDLILMDIRLPDIDGFEVTSIIKSINPKVPVIALTAYAMKLDKEGAFDVGCVDFLIKPLKEDSFLKTVEKYL